MIMRRERLFPRHRGLYGTVFSQPVFWLLAAVVLGLGILAESLPF